MNTTVKYLPAQSQIQEQPQCQWPQGADEHRMYLELFLQCLQLQLLYEASGDGEIGTLHPLLCCR